MSGSATAFNIATDTPATFAALHELVPKLDDGDEVALLDVDEQAAAAWANFVDDSLIQMNEVFSGTRAITALSTGTLTTTGAATVASLSSSGTVSGTTGMFSANVLAGSTSTSDVSLYIYSSSVGRIRWNDGANAGQLQYNHSVGVFYWSIEGSLAAQLSAGSWRAVSDNTLSTGTAGARWSTVYSYDGNFSDEVTVGGAFAHTGSTLGFYGTTPVTQSTGWTVSGGTALKSITTSSTTSEVRDCLRTLVEELRRTGIIGS